MQPSFLHVDFYRHAVLLIVILFITVHGLFHFVIQQLNFYDYFMLFFLISVNNANHCRNWTYQRFARVAEKKECIGTNKKSVTRKSIEVCCASRFLDLNLE